jgi:tetratricopeptide (TPR) repeat protein
VTFILNLTGTFGQELSLITQEKPKESVNRIEALPEYIENTFSSILLLDYNKALDSLRKITIPKELPYYEAWCHFINGQPFKAYENINIYLSSPSSNKYLGHILLGKIQFTRLHKHQSFEALDKAILLEPTKPYAYLEKSRIYALSKNLDEGLSFTNKYIKQFPNETNFYIYRALLYSDSNNPKKAITDFNTYLNSTSKKDSVDLLLVYFGLGKAHLIAKDYDNALVQTNTGLNLFPDYSPGYGLRGEIYFRLKDYDSSLRDFIKMDERMKSTYYWKFIASIYEIKGDNEAACSFYSELCRLFQDGEACSKTRKLKCKTTE